MSWFNHHSQPDGGPLLRGSAAPVPVNLRNDATPATVKLVPGRDDCHFSVQYTLSEYLSFMRAHAAYLIRRRRIGAMMGWWLLTKSSAAAGWHFVSQGRGRNVYEFSIDDHGIIRVCGSGVTLVPWNDVSAIRRYARGYLVVLKRGTLPIPLRCLTAQEVRSMNVFTARVKATVRR